MESKSQLGEVGRRVEKALLSQENWEAQFKQQLMLSLETVDRQHEEEEQLARALIESDAKRKQEAKAQADVIEQLRQENAALTLAAKESENKLALERLAWAAAEQRSRDDEKSEEGGGGRAVEEIPTSNQENKRLPLYSLAQCVQQTVQGQPLIATLCAMWIALLWVVVTRACRLVCAFTPYRVICGVRKLRKKRGEKHADL